MSKISLRILIYGSVGTALAFALLIGPSLLVPNTDAVESEDCICDQGQRTQTRWGLGSTCQASLNDLDAQASADYNAEAPNVCDPPCSSFPFGPGEGCEPQLIVTGSCTWQSQHQAYVTDGHYSYGCLSCP